MVYAAFTGSARSSEKLFDIGDTSGQIAIAMYRQGVSQNMLVQLNSATGYSAVSTNSPIVQNEWAVYALRYRVSSNLLELFKNGVSIASSTMSSAITDFTTTYSYIGRSASGAYFNGNIAGLYIYDRYLSNLEMSYISYQLTLKGIIFPCNIFNCI